MTRDEYIQSLRRDADGFAAAADGNLEAPVASCPGWTVADLVWHMGEVHQFWGLIARERLDSWEQAEELKDTRPPDEELLAWYRDGVEKLIATLADADPAIPVWTWAPQKNIGFVQRRMAQETAVHRWDAEAARGNTWAIDAAIAVDGIDEFLDLFLDDRSEGHDDHESVHLHCTDTAPGSDGAGSGEWLVRLDGETATVTRGHEKGDAAARGTASDLLLLLWRRIPPTAIDVVGDAGALDRFVERTILE